MIFWLRVEERQPLDGQSGFFFEQFCEQCGGFGLERGRRRNVVIVSACVRPPIEIKAGITFFDGICDLVSHVKTNDEE